MRKIAVFLSVFLAAVSARPETGYDYVSPSYTNLKSEIQINPTSIAINPPSNIYDGVFPGVNDRFNHNLNRHQKHVYFFAAPDDEPPARVRVYVAPSSRKNTKIIFIKAPSYGGVVPEVIAPPSQAEDKTLVYVLVKKPQHSGSVTIPASLGVKQAKPEVFFIKYKNQQEAESAVSQGLTGQHVGVGIESLGSAQDFTKTLNGRGVNVPDIDVRGNLYGSSTTGIVGGIATGVRYGPPTGSGPYKYK